MANVTKCVNTKCKIKKICYRYLVRDGARQSYINFNDNKEIKEKGECKFFLNRNEGGKK